MKPSTRAVLAFCAAAAVSCVLKEEEAPPLTGPSEFSTSITVGALPDILPTDGRSKSLITVTAHDAQGIPLRNLSMRADTLLNGLSADLGSLSARSVVTDASGRATLAYTAPAIDGELDTGTRVEIGITPAGTNFANAVTRTTTIRLVPSVPLR